jgi:restriction system protein
MGRIVFQRSALNGTLSELVGYKAGLALTQEQLAAHTDEAYHDLLLGDLEQTIAIRAEEAEELVAQLLYGVGYTPVRERVFLPTIEVYHLIKHRPGGPEAYEAFQTILLSEFRAQEASSAPFDIAPVLERCLDEAGALGAEIVLKFMDLMQINIDQSPWNRIRRIAWTDVTELDDLFKSESLSTPHGAYIDQRFVDYLSHNFTDVDRMNWRKFEGLTCEFFERAGYKVEISEGRNDGGVDARIWHESALPGTPPAILVQCKRQKEKVGKVVVKALWADVVAEGADSGLIVTTSALAPGASEVCSARAYPVASADRKTIRQWIEQLRTPHTGVFLGE